jgi:N-acetylmuramoyl-L-alanine amidase
MAKRKINHIVVHTSASRNNTKGVLDPSAADIDAMHCKNGWSGIGYHRVIRLDGTIDQGRKDDMAGAGHKWANAKTLHVCCTGAADHEDFTKAQYDSLFEVIYEWLLEYDLIGKFQANPMRVIGHYENNNLVADGLDEKRAKTTKSCPGRKVDMKKLRLRLVNYVAGAEVQRKAFVESGGLNWFALEMNMIVITSLTGPRIRSRTTLGSRATLGICASLFSARTHAT